MGFRKLYYFLRIWDIGEFWHKICKSLILDNDSCLEDNIKFTKLHNLLFMRHQAFEALV